MPIRSNPLLVKEYRESTNYVIAAPPVNSSGDVYHYLAYLILCLAKNWHVPKVYIAYDDETTKIQADRCVALAQQLGFTQYVISIQIKYNNASHANVREKQLRAEMNNRKLKTINQKGVTALLACAYIKYGFKHITAILQEGFLNFDPDFISAGDLAVIRNYAHARIAQIRAKTTKPIIILNHRVSKGANAQQSLSVAVVKQLRDTVRSQGYELVILSTSGDELDTYQACPATAAFYGGPGVETKYGKVYHMVLLAELWKTNQVYGVIGGTSGTLDIAAFLGLDCFNIHEFTQPNKLKYPIQAQEYRILTQSVWMTVMPPWSAYTRDNLIAWLRNNINKHHLPKEYKLTSKGNHKDRHAVTCFNNEGITTCSQNCPFHPYQNLLDNIVRSQLNGEQVPENNLSYPGKFQLFDNYGDIKCPFF